jgi:hypothetical protein
MARVGEMFPGAYLKAEDLGAVRPVLQIRMVASEKLGDELKWVVYFTGKDKGLVLNKTNAHMISEIAGTDDSDEWPGTVLRLYATTTEFQGKRVACLRIDRAPAGVGAVAAPVLPPPPSPTSPEEDIPFSVVLLPFLTAGAYLCQSFLA